MLERNLAKKSFSKRLSLAVIVMVSGLLFILSFKGNPGNPTPQQVEFELNSPGKPFESSQERSRWALILSLYHDKTFAIDNYASIGTPDIGFIKGHYYSFFPPGLSVIALPFYALGLALGNSQLVVFAMPILFSMGAMVLIYLFCRRLGVANSIAMMSALGFGFATPSWGYSTTLFAHVLSAFFILLGLYLAIFNENSKWYKLVLVWLIYAILVFIDFPNAFIFAPVAIFMSLNVFTFKLGKNALKLGIRPKHVLAGSVFAFAMLLYGYYNFVHFGHPLYLSNTIPRVRDLKVVEESVPEKYRNAGQSLSTRNIVNGLYTFTISHDRGLLIYSPVVLLSIFGIFHLWRKQSRVKILLVSIPATCLTLYSMFGDPYGGWAFGSRYMVAVMPELLILAGVGFDYFYKKLLIKVLYNALYIYSSAMALLAAITTNIVPPRVEAEQLGLESSFVVNWQMLKNGSLSSYFYNHVLNRSVSSLIYYLVIFAALTVIFTILVWLPAVRFRSEK